MAFDFLLVSFSPNFGGELLPPNNLFPAIDNASANAPLPELPADSNFSELLDIANGGVVERYVVLVGIGCAWRF